MATQPKAPTMSLDEALASLDGVAAAVVAEFAQANPERCAQATSHLSTARMAIEHLHTEVPFKTGA